MQQGQEYGQLEMPCRTKLSHWMIDRYCQGVRSTEYGGIKAVTYPVSLAMVFPRI